MKTSTVTSLRTHHSEPSRDLLPKEVTDLSSAIATKCAECDTIRSEIERANGAASEAERLDAEIAVLQQQRVEVKAKAFISRQLADLTELDRQQHELETASRNAREDGAAAAVAIGLLQEQIGEHEAAIEQLTEQRRQAVVAWLTDRREKAFDRYLTALTELGPIVADAVAADRALTAVGEHRSAPPAQLLLRELLDVTMPIPYTRMQRQPYGAITPIMWLRDSTYGTSEAQQLRELLQEAGVLA